eukprot:1838398-Pyramimonas_sp.AAC.1
MMKRRVAPCGPGETVTRRDDSTTLKKPHHADRHGHDPREGYEAAPAPRNEIPRTPEAAPTPPHMARAMAVCGGLGRGAPRRPHNKRRRRPYDGREWVNRSGSRQQCLT